jgi:hypothetical protein
LLKLKINKNLFLHNHYQLHQERFPNLAELQEQRAAEFRAEKKAETRMRLQAEKSAKREREEQAKLRSYSSIMRQDHMTSNAEMHATEDDRYVTLFMNYMIIYILFYIFDSAAKGYEDDFM